MRKTTFEAARGRPRNTAVFMNAIKMIKTHELKVRNTIFSAGEAGEVCEKIGPDSYREAFVVSFLPPHMHAQKYLLLLPLFFGEAKKSKMKSKMKIRIFEILLNKE